MKSQLKLLALKYLSDKQLSGTEIAARIEDGTGWEPSPGTLYPAMEKLENKGYIESRKEGRRKIYNITEKGEKELKSFMQDQEKYWGQIIQNLRNYSEMFEQEELQDLINHLEKARDSDFVAPYPVIVSYRIMDLLSHYEDLEKDQKKELNHVMERTQERVEEMVRQ